MSVSGRQVHALASSVVLDAQDRRAGRVHDVFLDDRTGMIAAISVVMGRLLVREILVPIDLVLEVDSNRVQVPVTVDMLREGFPTPAVGHVVASDLEAARRALSGSDAS